MDFLFKLIYLSFPKDLIRERFSAFTLDVKLLFLKVILLKSSHELKLLQESFFQLHPTWNIDWRNQWNLSLDILDNNLNSLYLDYESCLSSLVLFLANYFIRKILSFSGISNFFNYICFLIFIKKKKLLQWKIGLGYRLLP